MPIVSVLVDTLPPLVNTISIITAEMQKYGVSLLSDILVSDFSRLFLLENRAGASVVPEYLGVAKAGQPSWALGDVTVIRNPSPTQYGAFVVAGRVIGERGNPEISIMARYNGDSISKLLKLARNGCDHDLQVHMGSCQTPTDFNGGWGKILVVEGARPTNWGTDADIGALDTGERGVVNEDVPFSGLDMYEIVRMIVGELAGTEVLQEVADVVICDAVTCGLCGLSSDGCQVVFAAQVSTGGSPGVPARIIGTQNGGGTFVARAVSTLGASEDIDALACGGINLLVISQDSGSLHYAPIANILNSNETWAEVTTGFVAPTGSPRDIFSLGPTLIWIVGAGGYIYKSTDATAGVIVQSAGSATTESLNSIHGIDSLNLVAVGNNNAVVFTRNGGLSWASVTGPAVGVNLNTVVMKSQLEWHVGSAAGRLYYTRDGGTTWTEKSFPGSGSGSVRDIVYATPTVGYMAHSTSAPAGRVLRSIDGGGSWYVMPEGTGTIPTNDYISSLAVCVDPNIFYGGGLAGNAIDGILIKGA